MNHQIPAPHELPEFEQSLVFAAVGVTPVLIQDARFREKAGDLFLIGEIPTGFSSTDYAAGMTISLRWSSVDMYSIFPTITHYHEFQQGAAEAHKKPWWQIRREV